MPDASTHLQHAAAPAPTDRLPWFALGAPPAAWFAALVGSFAVVPWACRSGAGRLALHLICLAALSLAVAGLMAGGRAWRRAGGGWPGESPDTRERSRFLAAVATLGAGLFCLVILVQWVVVMVLGPCEPVPRLPFAPLL